MRTSLALVAFALNALSLWGFRLPALPRVLRDTSLQLLPNQQNNPMEDTDLVRRQSAVLDNPTTTRPAPPATETKLGVLLLNLGGPETQEDVEGFLYNLFADPDIIRLPDVLSGLQKPLAYFIAKKRAPKSAAAYLTIGGGSPIVKYTREQASLIQSALSERGFDSKCYFAMRYWHPYTEEVLDEMHKDGVNALVVVPLYPQYSISTSGSSLKLLQDIFLQQPERWGEDKVAHTVVPSWYHRPGYVSTMAKLIIEELVKYNADEMNYGLHILFSAHGVPESYVEAGDPYKRQMEECVKLIAYEVSRLLVDESARPASLSAEQAAELAGVVEGSLQGSLFNTNVDDSSQGAPGGSQGGSSFAPVQFHLSFQSRVGPVQWLKPYTETVLEELGESGVKNLVVVPVSFVSEHIETLEEIDVEYRELAEESGVTHWERVPAVNTDPRFINDMADLVVEALESPALSLSEATQNFELVEQQPQQLLLQDFENTNDPSLIFGFSKSAERINGRFAMMGIVGTTIFEMLAGHPILQMAGMK